MIDSLDDAIAEIKGIQRRLYRIVDFTGDSGSFEGLSPDLRVEIRRCLSQSRALNRSKNIIPNERWEGGPDALMALKESEKK